MATIKLKNGTGAPLASDLVQGEPALDLTNKRLYTEDTLGAVIEVGVNPTELNVTNNIVVGGTVDGRDIAADGTKLDTIETSADVTDTANVTAAGAVMDSELTDITAVKALNQGVATTDSPTFAAVTSTGNVTVGGTVDGRDVAADGTKLDTVETNADVTDTANVTAAGALMDSELTDIAAVKALNQGVATTDSPTFAGATVNGTVEFDGLSGTGAVTVTDILDQDDMSSNSATALATQQSIKSYVDSQVATSDTLAEVLANGNATGGTDVAFGDNDKALFGAGSDLQIYHDSNNSFVKDAGTGDLYVAADNLRLTNSSATEFYARGISNGAFSVYYDGAEKLATSSTGIDVTGTATADGLTVQTSQGNISIPTNTSSLNFDRAGSNYIRATDAAGSFTFITGANDFATQRLKIVSNGDVSFFEDTGTTAKFHWDASTERLGIGTSLPTTALDVTGTVTADAITSQGTLGNWSIDSQGAVQTFTRPSANYIRASDASGSLRFDTGGSLARMNIASNGDVSFYEDTGTTAKFFWDSSAETLILKGSDAGTAGLFVESSTAGVGARLDTIDATISNTASLTNSLLLDSDNHAIIRMDSNNNGSGDFYITESTSDTARLRIANNGDVSLFEDTGTTAKFYWDASAESLGIGRSNNIRDKLTVSTADTGTTFGPTTAAIDITNEDASGFGAYAGVNFRVGGGSYNESLAAVQAEYTAYSNNVMGELVFGTRKASTTDVTEAMRIDSSGNVGIGTDSPIAPLHVQSSSPQIALTETAGGVNRFLAFDVALSADIDTQFITVDQADALAFGEKLTASDRTIENEWMRITNTGLVGIGTDSPARPLHILAPSGNNVPVRVEAGATTTASYIDLKDASTTADFKVRIGSNGDELVAYAGGTEAMRIDSSQNVLVGKSNAGSNNVGVELRPQGYIFGTGDGINPLRLNRQTSHGMIADFQKDGVSVGSIGTHLSRIHMSSGTAGLFVDGGGTPAIWPWKSTATTSGDADAEVGLGDSNNRFKDLYLSGGVVFGTTGGNVTGATLDDYEEGTWTPEYEATTAFTSITYDSVTYGKYTKVGNLVHIQGIIRTDSISGGSGNVTLTGLPFTVGAAQFSSISLGYVSAFAGDSPGGMYVIGNGTSVSIRYRTTANGGLDNSLAVGDLDTGANKNYIAFGGTYITTA